MKCRCGKQMGKWFRGGGYTVWTHTHENGTVIAIAPDASSGVDFYLKVQP